MAQEIVHHEDSSGVNTVLIILLIVVVVGGAVWFFSRNRSPIAESNTPGIEINLPVGEANSGALIAPN